MKLLRYNLPALPLEEGDVISQKGKFVVVHHKDGTCHTGYHIK